MALEKTDNILTAAWDGRLEDVQSFVKAGANISEIGHALVRAACRNHFEVVRFLLKLARREDINTALILSSQQHTADSRKQVEIIKLLLDSGADVHDLNDNALCLACMKGTLEVVQLLLQYKADVHAQDGLPLGYAVERVLKGKIGIEIVQVLLEAGARLDSLPKDNLEEITPRLQ
jgi:hypothetical protein